jgi:hypothetical protein
VWTLAMAKEEYVAYYLHRFEDHYRLRALEALRALEPAGAIEATKEALKQPSLRADLRRKLEKALGEME